MFDPEARALVQAYEAASAVRVDRAAPITGLRFVVFDTETSGLDERRDSIVTIGAVGAAMGEIRIDDCFEEMVRVSYNSSSVVVHGVTRQEAMQGVSEAVAVARFLDYVRDSVVVGHHIGFDCRMIRRICQTQLGVDFNNPSVDTMALALQLSKKGDPRAEERQDFSLDGLCRRFAIDPHDRHTASGDAFLTAQVFLKLLSLARKAGLSQLSDLAPTDAETNFEFNQEHL